MTNWNKLKTALRNFKRKITTIYLVIKHKDTPWPLKLFGTFIIGYALSPIDLIPDFIPILGYLDDLILLPFLIFLFLKLIPQKIWLECESAAENPIPKTDHWIAAVVIILIWIGLLFLLVRTLIAWEKNV